MVLYRQLWSFIYNEITILPYQNYSFILNYLNYIKMLYTKIGLTNDVWQGDCRLLRDFMGFFFKQAAKFAIFTIGEQHCCVFGCNNSNERTKTLATRINYVAFQIEPQLKAQLKSAVNCNDRYLNPDSIHLCSVYLRIKVFIVSR